MRPKLVATLLALGTLALAGGGVFAATRPTWRHPAEMAKAHMVAASATGIPATRRASLRLRFRTAPAAHATTPPAAHATSSEARAASNSGAGAASITYTVKPGDTLSGIAEWFKLHGYGQLYAANKSVIGSDPNLIFMGQRITIAHGVMTLGRAARHPGSGA